MEKTLDEVYNEISLSKANLTAFKAIKNDDELVKFVSAHGVTSTAQEIRAFIDKKNNEELSDDELEQIAGGKDDGSNAAAPSRF